MRSFIAFFKKEMTEMARTYKLVIMLAIFLFFGITNPLIAKLMPLLFESLQDSTINITIADPTAMDSWTQFFKNTSTGMVVFVILLSGMFANEYSKGTLINFVAKGLPRKTIVFAKYMAALVLWTLSYFLSFFTTLIYTEYLWKGQTPPHLLEAVLFYFLYGILIISVLLLGAVLFKNLYGALLVTGGFTVVLSVLSMIPAIKKYTPQALSSESLSLLNHATTPSDLFIPSMISLVLVVCCVVLAIYSFNRKEL